MNALTVFAILIALVLLIVCVVFMRIRRELRSMTPVPTGKVVEGIYAIKDGNVNFYLVEAQGQYIAIDAGQNEKTVGKELNKLGIQKDRISAVFLTHTDRDHIGALGLFTKAIIYVPECEEALLNGTVHRIFIFNNKLSRPYEKIADDTTVQFENISVRSIHTPGHTPGSTCYLVNDEFLFTGDTLSLKNGRAGAFSRLFNMDTPGQMKSFKRINNLPGVKYILTAHHGFTDDYREAFKKLDA